MPLNHFLPAVGASTTGFRTPFGTWLQPGARVAAYVGPQSESTDAYVSSGLLVATLAAGLARCRAGKGDIVYVLPGHTETVSTTTMLDNLVSGTRIIGCAPMNTTLVPTFTWAGTTTTAIWALNDANVELSGLRLNFNGADSMDTPVIVTAAGVTIRDCVILTGSSTTLDSDVGITVSTGADFCSIENNYFYSLSTAVNTNAVLVSAAVDSFKFKNNTMFVPATSTNGILQVGAAAVVCTNLEIANNVIVNTSTGSACIGFTDVAHTGVCYNNYSGLTANTAPTTTGIVLAGTTNILVQFFENKTNDGEAKGTSGILSPAANDGT